MTELAEQPHQQSNFRDAPVLLDRLDDGGPEELPAIAFKVRAQDGDVCATEQPHRVVDLDTRIAEKLDRSAIRKRAQQAEGALARELAGLLELRIGFVSREGNVGQAERSHHLFHLVGHRVEGSLEDHLLRRHDQIRLRLDIHADGCDPYGKVLHLDDQLLKYGRLFIAMERMITARGVPDAASIAAPASFQVSVSGRNKGQWPS